MEIKEAANYLGQTCCFRKLIHMHVHMQKQLPKQYYYHVLYEMYIKLAYNLHDLKSIFIHLPQKQHLLSV